MSNLDVPILQELALDSKEVIDQGRSCGHRLQGVLVRMCSIGNDLLASCTASAMASLVTLPPHSSTMVSQAFPLSNHFQDLPNHDGARAAKGGLAVTNPGISNYVAWPTVAGLLLVSLIDLPHYFLRGV